MFSRRLGVVLTLRSALTSTQCLAIASIFLLKNFSALFGDSCIERFLEVNRVIVIIRRLRNYIFSLTHRGGGLVNSVLDNLRYGRARASYFVDKLVDIYLFLRFSG